LHCILGESDLWDKGTGVGFGRRLFVISFGHDPSLSPPWTVEQIPGGYKVKDANGQSLAYVYGRETQAEADIAKVLMNWWRLSWSNRSRRKS